MGLTREVTFTLPTELAERFDRQVRSLDRSSFVAAAIADRMEGRRQRLIAACDAANADPDDAALRREMDALPDTMAGDRWTETGPLTGV